MSFEDKQFQQSSVMHVALIGRPNRDTVIGHDDIINLIIALGATNDVNNFLEVIK